MSQSLATRLALPFVAFVAVGSTALVAWLQFEETRESRAAFIATANANAQFIRSQRLPTTERTAQALGEVLGMEVYFKRAGYEPVPELSERVATEERKSLAQAMTHREGEVYAIAGGESLRTPIDEQVSLLLFRKAPGVGGLWGPRTFAVLGGFWLLSLALVWVLANGIVGPLRRLAQRLPRIADDASEPALPESDRPDEIGQLARAYLDTRAALADERRARLQAERLATLGRMATGLAHEINNPVAAIKLHAQLLEAGTTSLHTAASPDDGGTDSLAIILSENAKIEALVNQWMFLARPQPPQTSPCDPAELIAAALRTHAPAAAHARVLLVNETQPGHRIAADSRRLGQAVGNVIVNAIQAMSADGGTLTIRSSRSEEPAAPDEPPTSNAQPRKVACRDHAALREPMPKAGVQPPREGVLPLNSQLSPRRPSTDFSRTRISTLNLTFTDTGPGFSATALARHAELFFSEKEGGMGIGLSVTAEILRAHGGDLLVANTAIGAVVTFILPLTTDENSEILNPKS